MKKILDKKIRNRIEQAFLRTESWMFFALILGCAILQTNTFVPHGWGQYFSYILVFCLAFSPTLIFLFFKEKLRAQSKSVYYVLLWGFCFAIWPILVGIFIQEVKPFRNILMYNEEGFFLLGGTFFFLASLLELSRFFQKKVKRIQWVQKFSLEKASFLILIFSTLFAASIVVSNLERFKQTGTVGMNVDLGEILSHVFTFISISFQFFLLYAVAYLLYFINHRFLIGKLLKRKGIIAYIMGVLGTIVLLYPIFAQLIIWLPLHQELQVLAPSENFLAFDYLNGGVAIIIMIISLPIILVFQWFQQNNQILSLEKQQVQTELDLLKQQINPHFFFNTLNNLYSLSQKQSNQTPEVILQLSELMRYVIYRGKEQRVKIKEEINYLEDYNSLQQIRLHKKLDYQFERDIEDYEWEIPPLLLVVLVENAYKHGIEPAEHTAFLHMHLKSSNGKVMFTCENSVEGKADLSGGLGIENLKRRLDLLFGTNYTLNLEAEGAIFKVHLSWQM